MCCTLLGDATSALRKLAVNAGYRPKTTIGLVGGQLFLKMGRTQYLFRRDLPVAAPAPKAP